MCKIKPFYTTHNIKAGRPRVDFHKATLMSIWYMTT